MLGGILSGAASLVSGITGMFDAKANRSMQREQNQADRDFALAQWNRENEYNNPKAQMERLKAAGLNPNLAYGTANTVSAHQQPPQSKPLPPLNNAALGEGISGGINSYVDLRQKKLQNDLLEVQKANMAQSLAESIAREANVKSQTKFREGIQTDKTNFEIGKLNIGFSRDAFSLKLAQDLRDNSIKSAMLDTQSKELKNKAQEINNMTLEQKNAFILEDLQSRIGLNKANKNSTEIRNQLEAMKAEYRKEGIEVTDNMWFRIISKFLSGNTDGKIYNGAMDLIKGKR